MGEALQDISRAGVRALLVLEEGYANGLITWGSRVTWRRHD